MWLHTFWSDSFPLLHTLYGPRGNYRHKKKVVAKMGGSQAGLHFKLTFTNVQEDLLPFHGGCYVEVLYVMIKAQTSELSYMGAVPDVMKLFVMLSSAEH